MIVRVRLVGTVIVSGIPGSSDRLMGKNKSQRRVLIIVENLPVPLDRRVWQEATTLSRSGYAVSIICPKGKGYVRSYEEIDGIHIYRHPLPMEASGLLGYVVEYGVALWWEFILAWRVYLTRGFDVIHACNPPDLIFVIGLIFKLMGKKYLFDHHDINPELFRVKFGKSGGLYRVLLLLERLSFWSADVSIATNESYKRVAIERGRMDPGKVFIVRSGPDITRVAVVPSKESLEKKRFLVGYVGVMGNQDGIDHLLRVARYITRERGRRDVQFVLIGGGPELDRMKAYACDLGIEDSVTFTGFLQGRELLGALGSIDIGVGPDPMNEYNDKCTMNKIMEYMALAKPIVQYDLTEGRVSAGDASLYAENNDEVDMGDKIIQLLGDNELRARMGDIGRKRVEAELAWEHEAPRLLAAYDEVFKG